MNNIKKMVNQLEGVTVDGFAELANYLAKIPGIETFSINPKEGDYKSLATLSYLSTLFEGDGCKSQPITLRVKHRKTKKGATSYSIGTECGTIWFEIARVAA